MSSKHSYGLSLAESQHRHLTFAHVEYTGVNGGVPTSYRDRSGVLDKTTPFTYVGEGQIRLNLRNDWKGISGSVQTLSTTATHQARLEARVTTAGSCSVTVRSAIADTADDLPGIVHLVDLFLSQSDDF